MNLLSLILHCLESGPVRNGLDLFRRWGESKEFSYLLYTASQVLKAIQWKGDRQYASSKKKDTRLGCALASYILTIYIFLHSMFSALHWSQVLYSQTQPVAKINLILLFQRPVPFPVNFSRFQGMGSDVFCLSVFSICFTSFRSSYIMTIVFSSSMCLFQVSAWSK